MTATLVGHNAFGFADGNAGHVVDLGSAPVAGQWDVICLCSVTVISSVSGFGTVIDHHLNNDDVQVYARLAAGGEGQTFTVTTSGNFNTGVWWQRWSGLDTPIDAHNLAVLDASAATTTPAGDTGPLSTATDVVVVFGVTSNTGLANQVGSWVGAGYSPIQDPLFVASGVQGVYGASGYKTGAGTTHETPQLSWTGDGVSNCHTASLAFTLAATPPPATSNSESILRMRRRAIR